MRGGVKVAIAPKTFEVLLYLVQNSGRVVLKGDLLKAVWPDSFVEESNLTQHVFWLRKALTDKADYIATIPGRGYEFTGKVRAIHEPEPHPPSVAGFHIQRSVERTRVVVEETGIAATPRALAGSVQARRGWVIAGTALALLALVVWGAWHRLQGAVPGDHHEVVLADFENSTGDPDFDRALRTLLSMDLDESPYLVVAGESDTGKILRLMNRSPDEPLTPVVAREVCQRLNDQVVLSGLIARFGQKYLITLTATDCSDGRDIVQSKAVADNREDVLKTVDFIAADMRKQLGESLKSRTESAQPLPLVPTFSLDALKVYSQALSLYSAGRRREAIPLFQQATELDSRFAAAYLDLARSYSSIHEDDEARVAITKAYELPDQGDDLLRLRIVDSYNSLVTGDMYAQLRALILQTQLYPNQAQPWIDLSNLQWVMGHPDLGVQAGRQAVALAPNNGYAYTALASSLRHAGYVEEAKATCREAIHRKIDTPVTREILYEIAFMQHDPAGMAEQMERSKGTDEEDHLRMHSLLAEGKAHAAVALWLQVIARMRKQGLQETAERTRRILLRREADYSMDTELLQQLPTIDPDKYPQNVVIANAELRRIAAAEAGLRALASVVGAATVTREVDNQQAVAAVALARHKPEDAIAELEGCRPYDSASLEGASMRARAYFAAGKPELAETEFKKVIDHQFVSPVTQSIPLAHLGRARALEMEGNHAAARREYETLFELWKDADADLPPLRQARQEYAKLH